MVAADMSSILDRLKAAKRLPSPPGTALRVLELCRREDTDVFEIADAIMSDPALSGRLLRYANCSFIGVERKVASVRDAVLLLGLRAVKLTALGFSIASPEFQPRCPGFQLRQFWAESFVTAAIARRVAAEFFKTDREEAFTAGLLVRIGRLALANGLPDEYSRVLEAARGGTPLREAEQVALGIDHLQLGSQIMAHWGLPEKLVEAVQGLTPNGRTCPTGSVQPLVDIMGVAMELAPLFLSADQPTEAQRARAREVIENKLKLDERDWSLISNEILVDCQEVFSLFDIQLDEPTSAFDLYAEAQEKAIQVGMVAQFERTRAMEENKDLLRRATTDSLTGVANRSKFDERLREALAELKRGLRHFAVIMFDIDYFKKFNDTYGHDVGDQVLKHVAATARSLLRETDLLARYGGEEFIILAPEQDQRAACTVAARIRRCVAGTPFDYNGRTLNVTISVGLTFTQDYATLPDAERIIADTDKQLYLSKRFGRNTWSYLDRTASRVAATTMIR